MADELQLYVKKIPSCKKCPFNVIQDYQTNNNNIKNKEFCLLKSQLHSSQYGGVNIVDHKKYPCPLKEVNKYLYVQIGNTKYPVEVEDK